MIGLRLVAGMRVIGTGGIYFGLLVFLFFYLWREWIKGECVLLSFPLFVFESFPAICVMVLLEARVC